VGEPVTNAYLTATATTVSAVDETFVLTSGTYANGQVLVRQSNAAGNTSANSPAIGAVTVDNTAASAPSVSLVLDTGNSNSDGITTNGRMRVQGLEDGASWQYSTNGGTTWAAGTAGTAVTLSTLTPNMVTATLSGGSILTASAATVSSWTLNAAGNRTAWLLMYDGMTYTKGVQVEFSTSAGALQVKILDAAYATGNHLTDWDAIASSRNVQSIATSSGAVGYGVERLSIVGELTSSNYLTTTPTTISALDESFVLGNGTYASGQVLVRQVDVAGNTSANSAAISAVTVDTTAAASPTFNMVADTGASNSDGCQLAVQHQRWQHLDTRHTSELGHIDSSHGVRNYCGRIRH